MGALQFDTATIPEEGFHLDERFPVAEIQPDAVEPIAAQDFCLRGFLDPMGNGYLFRGTLEAEFQHPCDRCLATALEPVALEVVWDFEDQPERQIYHDEEEDSLEETYSEFRRIEGGVVDIGAAVWEELVFNAPTKYTCQEDCKGLCPKCGINLNTGECACTIEEPKEPEANRGLSGLADMFPDLAPGKQEE